MIYEIVIQQMQSNFQEVKDELKKAIRALPDNPRIKRRIGNSFIMSASVLSDNWSVEYQDFPVQYEALCELIDASTIENLLPRLKQAIETATLKRNGQTLKLHPDVVNHLRKRLDIPVPA